MAGSGVTLYAVTAAGNKAVIGTIDWREDVYMPSQINDNVGQIMADIRALANAVGAGWVEVGDGDGVYTATYVSATSFRFDGVDVTATYRPGCRVRVVAPTPGTLTGTITSSAFSTHTTLVVVWDSGSLSNEAITTVQLGIGSADTTNPALAISKSYRNLLGRNGGLEVWQRGAGGGSATFAIAANASQYTADGWFFACGSNQASHVYQAGPLANGSRYGTSIVRDAGQAGVGAMLIEFPLDTDEIVPMRGSIVTLSLVLQALANFSAASGNVRCTLFTGTGAPAKRALGAYTGEINPLDATPAITATAVRYTFTSSVVVPANTTQASLMVQWTPVGTAGALDGIVIDDVQLEVGSVATPFERRPFESELLACRRHYWKTFAYNLKPDFIVDGEGMIEHTTYANGTLAIQGGIDVRHPVAMRSSPTVACYNPASFNTEFRNYSVGGDCSGTASASGPDRTRFATTTPGSTGPGHRLAIHATFDAGI